MNEYKIVEIAPNALATWVNEQIHPNMAVVLDVRESWELTMSNIKTNMCSVLTLPMSQLQQRWSELNPKAPVAVMCHHGVRSLRVAQFLVHNGFTNVVNITGGIAAWSEQLDASVPKY